MFDVMDALAQVRHATDADNQFLVDLMAHVPMEGSLALSTQRGPDFFSLYRMQRGTSDVFVCEDDHFAGMGTIFVRDGFLDGRAQKVGYLGDLRLRGKGRLRRVFPLAYGKLFADVVARENCEHFVTAVMSTNAMALASLTRRKKHRAGQPHYALICRYDMASLQLVLPPKPVDERVTIARKDDVDEIAAFLADDHRSRAFGYRFDDGELQHRLASWPGFSLDDTFVVREQGKIVACCTAWDPSPVKRYRVERYAGSMKLVRAGVSLASIATGCAKLPKVGEEFRSLYLVNLSVTDPKVLHAMLRAVYAHAWKKRFHFVGLPMFAMNGAPDPLEPALQGFVVQRLGFHLYGVTSSEKPRLEWPQSRPGFEIALA
jgi:hypothetical protein